MCWTQHFWISRSQHSGFPGPKILDFPTSQNLDFPASKKSTRQASRWGITTWGSPISTSIKMHTDKGEIHYHIPPPYWPPFRWSDISEYLIFCDIVIMDALTSQIGSKYMGETYFQESDLRIWVKNMFKNLTNTYGWTIFQESDLRIWVTNIVRNFGRKYMPVLCQEYMLFFCLPLSSQPRLNLLSPQKQGPPPRPPVVVGWGGWALADYSTAEDGHIFLTCLQLVGTWV